MKALHTKTFPVNLTSFLQLLKHKTGSLTSTSSKYNTLWHIFFNGPRNKLTWQPPRIFSNDELMDFEKMQERA